VREAVALHARRASERGEDAVRRVEILRLRFAEDLPVREIARRLEADPARVHHQYAQARQEFREVLRDVVRFHHPGEAGAVDAECARLLQAFADD
jgi:RNA polymerase sigma-70 factor (ECF subfamily)